MKQLLPQQAGAWQTAQFGTPFLLVFFVYTSSDPGVPVELKVDERLRVHDLTWRDLPIRPQRFLVAT